LNELSAMKVSVTISTKNRKAELLRTLERIGRLDPAPWEVIVCADGCTDGTAEAARAALPTARVIEHREPLGSIVSRNEMMGVATGDVALSLDDDSYPLEEDFIARIGTLFDGNARLAVAMFPQRSDEFPETLERSDFGPGRPVGSYANSGAAIRREVFLALRGYPAVFGHAYEEPDFALRCRAAGWEVWFEPVATIRHHWTGTGRNERRVHRLHARNEIWSVLMRCPMPWLPVVAMFRLVRQFGYACRRGPGWVIGEPLWWFEAARGAGAALAARKPVGWRDYLSWMKLLSAGGAAPVKGAG
jgi:glycosyltransferase involved in cell wall biosynthesis